GRPICAWVGARPLGGAPGPHRRVAGAGPQRDPLRRNDAARQPVCARLVVPDRCEAAATNNPRRGPAPRRLLMTNVVVGPSVAPPEKRQFVLVGGAGFVG